MLDQASSSVFVSVYHSVWCKPIALYPNCPISGFLYHLPVEEPSLSDALFPVSCPQSHITHSIVCDWRLNIPREPFLWRLPQSPPIVSIIVMIDSRTRILLVPSLVSLRAETMCYIATGLHASLAKRSTSPPWKMLKRYGRSDTLCLFPSVSAQYSQMLFSDSV